jgi:hypothetical protein
VTHALHTQFDLATSDIRFPTNASNIFNKLAPHQDDFFLQNGFSKMLDVTTEIVYLPLKPGLDLSADENKQQWKDTLGTIKRQPGVVRVLWGRQIENPNTVQLVVGM